MTRSRLYAVLTAALMLVGLAVAAFPSTASAAAAATGSPAATAGSPVAVSTADRAAVAASGAVTPSRPGGSVIVVGAAGLSWSDVSASHTPALWSMLRHGATATVTVRSVHSNTCPVDGWLTIGAGQRAADVSSAGNDTRPACRPLPDQLVDGAVPLWSTYQAAARTTGFDAQLGLLAQQARLGGDCIQAIGPGAALGAALPDGRVEHYLPFTASTLPRALAACPAALVDVGSIRQPGDLATGEPAPSASRAEQVAAVDARVGQVLSAAPAGARVMVVGLADSGLTERLRLVAMQGPGFDAGSLESLSTRQPGLIQLTDVTPTILAQLGLPLPDALGGTPLRQVGAPDSSTQAAQGRLQALVDYDQASHEVHNLVEPFFDGLVGTQLAIYIFVLVVWRRRWGSQATRLRLLRVVRLVATVSATVPVSTFLANLLPWWRFSVPMLAIVASVGLFVLAISLLALLGPWRRRLFGPLAVVATVTMLVLAVDVMTGSRLQLSSLMGLQPVVAGRFYGMGNVTFALFAAATLLLGTAVGDHLLHTDRRRLAAGAIAAIGLFGVVVDGNPSWGADFGGPPALLPAVALLFLAALGLRLNWRRAVGICAGTAAFVVVVSVLDWLRPPESRSHLGRFVQTVIDGGAFTVIGRKAQQNWDILTGNMPLTLFVPLGLAFVIYVLARPTSWGSRALQRSFERAPLFRPGLISLLVMVVIGFAVNDSGTAIPAVAAALAIPLVIAVSVQTLLDEAPPGGGESPAGPEGLVATGAEPPKTRL